MVNTNHKDLTGVSLHEPKGTAAATVNQYYITDGAASGAMGDIHPKFAVYQYQETDGVDGDAYTSSYAAVDLNTEVDDADSIGTLASKAVTLAAGSYVLKGYVGAHLLENASALVRTRIQNTTDGTTEGLSICSTFVITGSKAFEFQIQAITTGQSLFTGVDDGSAAGVEVYATLEVWKIK